MGPETKTTKRDTKTLLRCFDSGPTAVDIPYARDSD